MRNYEVAYIADPDLDEQALAALEEKVTSWIEAAGGKTVQVDRWGKRRMAYSIRKRMDGYYVFVKAELPPQATATLERDLRLQEPVLRFLLTVAEAA
jgi:small subunit ribosomal protein S6